MSINRDATWKRTTDDDERRVKSTGAASANLGRAFQTRHTTTLAEYLAKVMAERPTAYKREVESLLPDVFDALAGIPKDTIAAAMLRGVVNCHHLVGQKNVAKVLVAMGDELQTEARGVFVRGAMKEILGEDGGTKEFARLEKAMARKASTYKRRQVELAVLRKHAIHFEPWPRILSEHVGAFACDSLLRALPDEIVQDDYKLARVAEEAWKAFDIYLGKPIYEPSVEPQYPWFGFDGVDGEVFVAACRDVPAVRAALERGIPHMGAVNYLKSTGFRINEHVLDVVKAMRGCAGVGTGKYTVSKIPVARDKFGGISQMGFLQLRPDLLKKVKDDGAEDLLEQNIATADRFAGKAFRISLRVDFRGRLVAGPNLNFTGPDHIRGLFRFDTLDRPTPITKDGIRWLKIACATAYDEHKEISKQTFAKRLAWAELNLDRICAAGRDPLDHLHWLVEAGDPLQCVALFHELANAMEEGASYRCSVPIGFDAHASGLQHFALLARDKSAAMKTNLVPTIGEGIRPDVYVAPEILRGTYEGRKDDPNPVADRPPSSTYEYVEPQDIYDFVQVHVKRALQRSTKDGDELAEWWLGSRKMVDELEVQEPSRLDRKILKALVMTYGYSAEEWGQRSGVYKILRARHNQVGDIPKVGEHDAVYYLVKLVRKAIETLIPTAPKIMKALQALVDGMREFTGRTKTRGRFASPSEDAAALEEFSGSSPAMFPVINLTWPISWVSPSGLPVANSYPKRRTARVRCYIAGRLLRPVTSVAWLPGQRFRQARSSIAPNYIHSLDSAHLALVANVCEREGIPLVTVHDSYSVLPPHADRLREILLEELAQMYRSYTALVPPTGDLDLEEVTGPYAFS